MRQRDDLVDAVLPGYESEIGATLWRLQEARERTLRALEGVRDAEIDDDRSGNSVGTILYHTALIEADWLYTEIAEEPVPESLKPRFPTSDRDEMGTLSAIRGESLQDHLARLAAVREHVLERMRGMSAAEFHRVRALPNYDVTPAWVLHHLAQHEAEHRGELGKVLEVTRKAQSGQ